ncbi:translation elongation factor [Thermocrinis ruber]|uniref:Selenocysteine-specific elongation factor n=1 Tax=Thermocrinis ruber TaxID=75906 RepID=W0DB73_9AQUI|nr:selenocysteine-specific translation elongation factor [Thermocrinis ruber]AHE95749.1 translation elongation factor [Thermocrinis ruber]
MRFVPVGIAGHVDHGKTTLVKALTGIDTDRLPEEKRRGMSIDLGFAYLDYPEKGLRVELIDIPGHERFIKNAIAGLACVRGVLLVVDPVEGVMPETIKHTQLIKAFGIYHCVAVLTKADRVDEETLELARMELSEFLKDMGLRAYGLCAVSALSGIGLEELKKTIGEYAEEISGAGVEFLRIVLDSAFNVKGYGTVLRGSCLSGRVEEGDSLSLEPLGFEVRVKKIQNHGVFVKEGKEGERLALLVAGVEPSQVERGFVLVKKGQIAKSRHLLVEVEGEMPKGEGSLFFYMREIKFKRKKVSEKVYLLTLEEPVCAILGDRGPILDASGQLCASYRVIHPKPTVKRKRFIKERLDFLKEDPISYFLSEAGFRGLPLEVLGSLFGVHINPSKLGAVRIGDKLFAPTVVEGLREKLSAILSTKGGFLPLEELKSSLRVSEELLKYILSQLKGYRLVEGYILDERRANLEELEGFRELLEFMKGSIKEEAELERFKEVLPLAVRKGKVHSLGERLYILDEDLKEVLSKLRSLGDSFEVQQAKALLGLSRKYLIPLLEYIDYLGYTRREGNFRRFIK